MILDQKELEGGKRWFFGAGIVAILLALTLWKIDDFLTYSDKEIRLGETLLELRSAQTSLNSDVSDSRLIGPSSHAEIDQLK
jgi:hypothetical protein